MRCLTVHTIHVVGLGAIGTLLGVAFANAGLAVHTYRGGRAPQRRLRVRHKDREDTVLVINHQARMPCVQENEAVLLAVKWPQMQSVLAAMEPSLPNACPLFLPQNGLINEEVRALAGHLTFVPIVVHASAVRIERGTAVANGSSQFLMSDASPLSASANLQREGFRFLPEPEFRSAQLLKLLIACMSAKMALRRVSIGAAFRDPHLRAELAAIVKEAASVLVTYCNGEPHLKSETDNLAQRIASGSLIDVDTMESAYTSLHYDLNVRQRETEVFWLNGFVEQLARRFRIETPLNHALLEEIKCRQPWAAVKERELL